MIKKIIKYDFKSLNKPLLFLYIITILTSLINIIASNYGKSDSSIAIFLLSTDFALLFLIGTIFFSVITCFSRFRESMFKDEAYLTHTLPIKRTSLYDAKMITSIITILISLVVVGICFVYVFSHMSFIHYIMSISKNADDLYKVIYFSAHATIEVFLFFMCLINGLISGYKFDKNKDLITFIISILLFLILQILLSSVISLFDKSLWDLLDVIFGIVLCISLYITGRFRLKKGVNIN